MKAVGEALDPPVKPRQAARLLAAAPPPVEPAPATEPKAAETGSREPTRAKSGRFAAVPDEPEKPPQGRVMGILRMGFDGGDATWYTSTPEGRGEVLKQSLVGTEDRDEYDGTFLRGVAAAYREQDLWNARVRAVERGESAVDFQVASTGKVERLFASDLPLYRHHRMPR